MGAGTHGCHQIVDVVLTCQSTGELKAPAFDVQDQLGPFHPGLDHKGMNLMLLRHSEGDSANGIGEGALRDRWIISIHHSNPKSGVVGQIEESSLRSKVLIERLVKIEVILSEIGKDSHLETALIGSLQCQSVRRDLDDSAPALLFHGAGKNLLYLRCLGRGSNRLLNLPAHNGLDRAHQDGRPPRLQNRMNQIGRCGLTIGTRNARQLQFMGTGNRSSDSPSGPCSGELLELPARRPENQPVPGRSETIAAAPWERAWGMN